MQNILLPHIVKSQLRESLKSKRLNLSLEERQQLDFSANRHLIDFLKPHLCTSVSKKSIALFLAFQGEISPSQTIDYLLENNTPVYLPVLHPFDKRTLLFVNYTKSTKLIKNRFGILEPELTVSAILPVDQIDFFVMPLTAFDKRGNRLGMGGGFYDKTLAHLTHPERLIGFAYSLQEVNDIPTEPWDLRLGAIITDQTISTYDI